MIRIRSIARTIAGLAAVAASTIALASATPAAADDVTAKVVGGHSVNVRQGPSVHTKITGEVTKGEKIRIACELSGTDVEGNPTWYGLKDGQGYVSGAYIDTGEFTPHECPDIETEYGVGVTTTDLHVRNGPSQHDKRVKTLASGTKIRIVCAAVGTKANNTNKWYALDTYTGEDGEAYPRQGQWVSAEFVERQTTVKSDWQSCNA